MAGNTLRAVAIALALLAPASLAAVEPDRLLAESDAAAELISRDRAAEIVRSATGGQVLRVELRGDEQPWYAVRVLIDGERVRSLVVDARTGRLRE